MLLQKPLEFEVSCASIASACMSNCSCFGNFDPVTEETLNVFDICGHGVWAGL